MLIEEPHCKVCAVYTQPDRPAGRGRKLSASPIKTLALAHEIPVEQPESWRTATTLASLRALEPDLLVVVAYGVILPEAALAIPRLGAVNVHASLLPRWRGAAPIERALMAGDSRTGVSIMQVVRELDAGPVYCASSCDILETDTGGSLRERLAQLGAQSLLQVVHALDAGRAVAVPQDSAAVTYAAKITAADRELVWASPATVLARQVRALNPTPLAITTSLGVTFAVLEATALPTTRVEEPGVVIALSGTGIDVTTGDGILRLLRVQPVGKRPMSAQEFANGYGRKLFTS